MVDLLAGFVFVAICLALLPGPFALLCTHYGRQYSKDLVHGVAVILGVVSVPLGVFWWRTIYTEWRYLGLVSAACGAVAVFLAVRAYLYGR